MLTTDVDGLALIERSEGLRLQVYQDQAGKPTIGYGHLVRPGEDFTGGITAEDAVALLQKDLRDAEVAVNSLVSVPLTQTQFDALADFCFNLGAGALAHSTLLRRLNSGDYDIGPEFLKWCYVHDPASGSAERDAGLLIRRHREQELWERKQ